MRKYFYELLYKYISVSVQPEDRIVEVFPYDDALIRLFSNGSAVLQEGRHDEFPGVRCLRGMEEIKDVVPEFVLLNGTVHYERDIQSLLTAIRQYCAEDTRLVITYYSSLWKPAMRLASLLKLRHKLPEANWIAHEDMLNFLLLSWFEPVKVESRVLLPLWIPILSGLINRWIAPLPFFRSLTMVNILIARPVPTHAQSERKKPSVSVVIPARNEAGNVEALVNRLPRMGPDDEIIFIEGHSKDNTWETIQAIAGKYRRERNILSGRQTGVGKADAVRRGFDLATRDILMILDADMTVPPEKLTAFYEAIVSGKGEFINGSRLVYPMEKQAMQFLNILGNKFFAAAFSFVLGQRFKDTLCGTKVISRAHYIRLAKYRSFFGEFDPFGDFDLIFGAARMNLRIVEIPINYCERTYGSTNISRWRHGVLLLTMLYFAARRLKFV